MKEKFKLLVNKFKEFNRDTYGMLITVSWILLVICLVIKLFGGNWFELWWDNEKFIAVCNYVENRIGLKMVVACVTYLISGYFIISIVLKEKMKLKHILIFFPIMIFKSILGWYISGVTFILELLIIVILPIILTKNWKRVIITNILLFLFQLITIITRNLSAFGKFNETTLTIEALLYQIDYYIMIILCFLYTFKRKEVK